MTEFRWLSLRGVIDAQAELIDRFGGLPGLRDRGGLEAALNRPRQIMSYAPGEIDLASLAAAYAYGLSQNPPFVDGNKRIALLAMVMFVGKNGSYLDATEQSAYETVDGLAGGRVTEEKLAGWAQDNLIDGIETIKGREPSIP